MSELVFYPDAHPEVTSVDGQVYIWTNNQTWANLRNGIIFEGFGGLDFDDTWALNGFTITGGTNIDTWSELYRGIILFDTSPLAGLVIISAVLSLYGSSKEDGLNIAPNINVYAANPASNISLVGADFNTFGSDAFCKIPISYDSWLVNDWNDFILNSAGLAAISLGGITKFGIRNKNYDVDAVAPNWSGGNPSSGLYFNSADNGSNIPKLIITFISSQESVDQTIIGNKVSLEAIRNIEIVYGGRFYIDKLGKAVYESRYHRNV